MNETSRAEKAGLLFFALTGLFILLRLVPLLTASERIFRYDELDLGTTAKELIEGASLPFWNYQMDPYASESLVTGIAAIPFIKILGLNGLTIKIPAFLFAVASFCMLFFLMLRRFSKEKAVWAGLLLIFCPPSLVHFSLSSLCGHMESMPLVLAMLYFFYGFLYTEKQSSRSIFLSGLFGGLSFWLFHGNLVMILACLLSWFVLAPASLSGRFFMNFIAGTAAGLTPWLIYTAGRGAEEAVFISNTFHPFGIPKLYAETVIRKTWKLLSAGLPFSFNFFPVFGVHERVFSAGISALLCLPLFPAASGRFFRILKTRKDPEKILPFLLFPFVFFVIFFFLPFDLDYSIGYAGYRYLSSLQFFLLLLLAVLFSSDRLKKIFLFLFMSVCALGQTSLFFQESPARAIHFQGYSYYLSGPAWRTFFAKTVKTPGDFLNGPVRWDSTKGYFLLWEIANAGMITGEDTLVSGTPLRLDDLMPSLPPRSLPYLYEWKGSLLQTPEDVRRAAAALPPAEKQMLYKGYFEKPDGFSFEPLQTCPDCFSLPGPEGDWAYRALGKILYSRLTRHGFSGDVLRRGVEEAVHKIKSLKFSPEKESRIYEGMGMGGFYHRMESNLLWDRSAEIISASIPPQNRRDFLLGIGWNARAMFREDRKRALARLNIFTGEENADALKGLIAFESAYAIPLS